MGDTRRATKALAAAMLAVAVDAQAAGAMQSLSAELGIGFDDNVANVRQGGAARDAAFVQLGIVAGSAWRLSPASALQWQWLLDAQGFSEYDGLSQITPAVRLRWLYRPGGGFYTPTFALYARAAHAEHASSLRDAAEYRAGGFVQEQLTTRLSARVGWSASWRDARRQRVFAGGARSGTLDLDWLATRRLAIYAGYQYRDGDLVSSAANPPPAVLGAARAFADDDVFTGETAFRLSSSAHVGTLGVNFSLSPKLSLDLQTRHVEAEADTGVHYRRTQALVSLLWRL